MSDQDRNSIAQTGDPTGNGEGGASIFALCGDHQSRFFEQEVKPRIKHKKIGTVSMVNNGNGMHGSQFFLTLRDDLDHLDNTHTVFGEVSEGFDVLAKFNEAYCDKEGRPYRDIRVLHTIILDDPFDDPEGLAKHIPDRSPVPTEKQLKTTRIAFDEDVDDLKGLTEEQIIEITQEKEAKANAQILEMVGDIPYADVKPEDNVLFVCKLNPVTTDEDLEVIFSRFGEILTCEVIRDHVTENSLQYAFIEFAKAEDCENAYFKMDNVLIDDRRIHVDFSQSVSRIKWKGKGKGVSIQDDGNIDDEPEETPLYVLKKDKYQLGKGYDYVFEDPEDNVRSESSKSKKSSHKLERHDARNKETDNEKSGRKRDRSQSPRHSRKRKDSRDTGETSSSHRHRNKNDERRHRSRSKERHHHHYESRIRSNYMYDDKRHTDRSKHSHTSSRSRPTEGTKRRR